MFKVITSFIIGLKSGTIWNIQTPKQIKKIIIQLSSTDTKLLFFKTCMAAISDFISVVTDGAQTI